MRAEGDVLSDCVGDLRLTPKRHWHTISRQGTIENQKFRLKVRHVLRTNPKVGEESLRVTARLFGTLRSRVRSG